jgi:2-amino-4-hydroxy-6-hydroxymethyldihydropteridine diphosphokinase
MTAMRPATQAYVALGANLGNAQAALQSAAAALGSLPGTRLKQLSSFYRTAPIGASGPDYVNAVAAVSTSLSAPELLDALRAIETEAGRARPYPNAPRTLDLDLLFYGSGRIDSPRLTVPHPRWSKRAFVLLPLSEIAPELVSPELLQAVADQAAVRI